MHIDCTGLTVRDREGNPRIHLDASSDGYPFIRMSGRGGATIELAIDDDRPGIILREKNGHTSIVLTVQGEDHPVLSLLNKKGEFMASLSCWDDPNEVSAVIFRNGQPVWSSPTQKTETPKTEESDASTTD